MKEKVIAVIPARGGSKSIPRKNIKLFGGKPLIFYPIALAKSISFIDRVIVSTEDKEIAKVAKDLGAEVPFIRPEELARDETPTLPVLQHCIKYLEEKENYKPNIIVLLYATNPLLKKERLTEAINLIINKSCNSVVSVYKEIGHFWYEGENNLYKRLYPKDVVNRQLIKPLLREDGAIYITNYDTLMNKNLITDSESVEFVITNKDELIDIDTPADWEKAEGKIKWNSK